MSSRVFLYDANSGSCIVQESDATPPTPEKPDLWK